MFSSRMKIISIIWNCSNTGVIEEAVEICGDWNQYLQQAMKEPEDEFIRHSSTGRPLGGVDFIARAEKILKRDLQKKKPGPKVVQDD